MTKRIQRICVHCGCNAHHSWDVRPCAAKASKVRVWLCHLCDIALNRLTLEFIHHPDRERLIAAYRAELMGLAATIPETPDFAAHGPETGQDDTPDLFGEPT